MYHESGTHSHRYESPQSDSISYPLPPSTTKAVTVEDPIRIEETWFKPIQRDRSQDSLLQSSSSRSNIRTLSAGPRTMEVTSLSPQTQVTFGKYKPNEIIAIVRVPELSNGTDIKPDQLLPATSAIRHGASEPKLNIGARQGEEQLRQQPKLHYERVHAANYRPSIARQDNQQRSSRSRTSMPKNIGKFIYMYINVYMYMYIHIVMYTQIFVYNIFFFNINFILSRKFRFVFYLPMLSSRIGFERIRISVFLKLFLCILIIILSFLLFFFLYVIESYIYSTKSHLS